MDSDFLKKVRSNDRLSTKFVIASLFAEFFENHGDRVGEEDASITGGIGLFHGRPVTIIGINRGETLEERLAYNFGAVKPSGYRKAIRLLDQAEKFKRPVVTLINMPGADASVKSEQMGQSYVISEMILKMGALQVPNIAIFLGEGQSGGALALANANAIMMVENSLFSVASPEAVNAILKKSNPNEIETSLPMMATELFDRGLVDVILPEKNSAATIKAMDSELSKLVNVLVASSGADLIEQREMKYQTFLKNW
ncbi:carboxyltransferase subunit alpha [Dellaglioa sp. BT-FLS60]